MMQAPRLDRSESEELAEALGISKAEARRYLEEDRVARFVTAPAPIPTQAPAASPAQEPTEETKESLLSRLSKAAYEGKMVDVQEIIHKSQISVKAARLEGRTLLYSACRGPKCSPDVVHLLLREGACPKEESVYGSRPLHAVVQNYVESLRAGSASEDYVNKLCQIIQHLRNFSCDFMLRNNAGYTALQELNLPQHDHLIRTNPLSSRMKKELEILNSFQFIPVFDQLDPIPDLPSRQREKYRACREYLSIHPLPPLVTANLAELLWKSNETKHVIIVENTEFARFCETHTVTFDPTRLDLYLDGEPSMKVRLRVAEWPKDCGSAQSRQINPQVNWEWNLPGSGWVALDHPAVLDKLRVSKSDIEDPPSRYKVTDDFVLKGDGIYDGVAIRWLPCSEARQGDDTEESEDDLDVDELIGKEELAKVLVPLADGIEQDLPVPCEPFTPGMTVARAHHCNEQSKPERLEHSAQHLASLSDQAMKCVQTIDFAPIGVKNLNDSDFALYAMATSELPVRFSSSNDTVVVLSGRFARIVGPGETVITASQPGNERYQAAEEVQQRVVVRLVETVELTIKTKYLSSATVRLVSKLSSVLNITNMHDCKWDDKQNSVVFRGTADDILRLKNMFKGVNAVDACVNGARAELQNYFKFESSRIANVIRSSSPKLMPEDPVIRMCKGYMYTLRQLYKSFSEDALAKIDAFVTEHAPRFIDNILIDPIGAADVINHEIHSRVQTLKSEVFPDHDKLAGLEDSSKVSALKTFLQSGEYEVGDIYSTGTNNPKRFVKCWPNFFSNMHAQSKTFQAFFDVLMERASVDFRLSILLRDFHIHKVCVERNLPFYAEAANDLIDKVSRHDVTIVRTATGSGKSTLMPLILLAGGLNYKRIAITQPRRFAAESIQRKIAELYGPTICGFRMAGKCKNPSAPVIYITDGLLRAELGMQNTLMYDVIIIDEVHERSMEIDACNALLAYSKSQSQRMPKVILSSATFDEQVMRPFRDVHASVAELEQKVTKRYKAVEHYPDIGCMSFCSICTNLKRSSHHLEVIAWLHGRMQANEQLLCFLPSAKEVSEAVENLEKMNLHAKPLFAQQKGTVQLEYVSTGRIFISTNIAETSLTFPNLRFVVDCGKIQRPRATAAGSIQKAYLVMETVAASVSTLNQRRGRVGRTMDGDYVALYDKRSLTDGSRDEHITPKMQLEQHEDLLFSIQCQLKKPVRLTFPTLSAELPRLEDDFFRFPVLGGMKMAIAFRAAQAKYNCGDEILLLAALKMSFQSKGLQELAFNAKPIVPAANGDISIIISVLGKLSSDMPPDRGMAATERAVVAWCNQHGLSDSSRNLFRAYINYIKMKSYYLGVEPTRPHNKTHPMFQSVDKTIFDSPSRQWNGFLFGRKNEDGSPNMSCPENYISVRLTRCGGNFFNVIQALSEGYTSNFFIHCPMIDGPVNYYSRATDLGDVGDRDDNRMRTLSSMHSKSTLAKVKPELPGIIFALEFMLFGAEMPKNEDPFRLGVLQLVERVPNIADIPRHLSGERWVLLHDSDPAIPAEVTKYGMRFSVIRNAALALTLEGELKLRRDLRVSATVNLLPDDLAAMDPTYKKQMEANVKMLDSNKQIFRPLKNLWKNTVGLEVELRTGAQSPHILIQGRRRDTGRFIEHFKLWRKQLAMTPIVERPDQFTAVDLYRRPKALQSGDKEFRERLRTITAAELPESSIFNLSEGPRATRESRMELVARIAVQDFGCRICGGFVRDWIVNGERKHLPLPFSSWVEANAITTYDIKEGVVPKDLDLELPMDRYFDVARFVARARECGVQVDYHKHIAQRHVLLFESERGPFTADLIEPHFAVLHTLADFDVNTLCVVAYQDLIGLKMRYRFGDDSTLDVDAVIDNCRRRQLLTMHPQKGHGIVKERMAKMIKRGWVDAGERIFIPVDPATDYAIVQIRDPHPDFEHYRKEIAKISLDGKGPGRLVAMYEIKSRTTDSHYAAMKAEFERNLGGDANEKDLFHGTENNVVEEILKGGAKRILDAMHKFENI